MPDRGLDRLFSGPGFSEGGKPPLKFHKDYSGYEIVLLAMEIEKVGRLFYKYAQSLATLKEATDFFGKMADEELKHIQILEEKMVSFFRKQEYGWENEKIVAQYLRWSTGSNVFKDLEVLKRSVNAVKTQRQALDLCIIGKKKTVAFYKTILDQTTGEEGKMAIRYILDEEKRQVEELEKLKEG